jgi:PTS system fructose-specific IIB component
MKLVAVTSCPTGSARSRTAAESLREAAETAGHGISVEIRGAMGVENELSAAEIGAADAAIVAADTAVDDERFEGIPVVRVPVADAVTDADRLVRQAASLAGGADPPDSADAGVGSDHDGTEAAGGAGGPERSDDGAARPTGKPGSDDRSDAGHGGDAGPEGRSDGPSLAIRLLRRLFD